jgi:hypothetical protein
MRWTATVLCFLGALTTAMIVPALGQSSIFSGASTASASAVTNSSGKPSTFAIKRDFLAMQIAAIQRDIREAERCITNATNPVTLRDPEGNINRVPQTDALDCGRRLKQLVRQLAGIQRKADTLAQDAEVQGSFLETQMREAQRKARTQPLNQRSSGGM